MKILVVEDDEDFQERVLVHALRFSEPTLLASLKRRGITLTQSIEVEFVDNLDDARQKIRKQKKEEPFDLVILDLLIKESSGKKVDTSNGPLFGYELVKDLRSKFGHNVPIVVYSAYLDPKRKEYRKGIIKFQDMLRERNIGPPNEMLYKGFYEDPRVLRRKLIRYVIDLTSEDEATLEKANILVPQRGGTRQVLRELKRMACSASIGFPRSDVLLLGENGVGKSTFARAYHLLRPRRTDCPLLGFEHLDLGSLDFAGSAPNIALFGASDFNGAWSLGAFVRSTLYKRGDEFLQFAGQEFEFGFPSMAAKSSVDKLYPKSSDEVDFDGSGTLFLDEVVNIGVEVQAMLLQALSYDLHTRHVYTTGHSPRRLRVGPSLVFATAQRLDEKEPGRHEDTKFRQMKDYLFRIDQTRVTIPPLRERDPEEVLDLLKVLVMRRRPKPDRPEDKIQVDQLIKELLANTLVFRNNVADLQRIADQVMPEEPTISWQHVGPLFERERPIIAEVSGEGHLDDEPHESPSQTYAQAKKNYERYLAEHVRTDKKLTLSQLANKLDIRRIDAYNLALLFMDDCGCSLSKRWPRDDQTLAIFDHGTKAFQTYLHRISRRRSGPFNLNDALNDLAHLKIPTTSMNALPIDRG
jgi:DNA-binding NtrC family response regulator